MAPRKTPNILCVFQSKHANLTLPLKKPLPNGKTMIEFRNYRYQTVDPDEIALLKTATERKDPVSQIELVSEIDLDIVEETPPPPPPGGASGEGNPPGE